MSARRSARKAAPAGVAVGYLRVSREEQARDGLSLADQEARLRAHAAAQGLELIEVYRDEGVNAGKPLGMRPGGRALLNAVQDGRASAVLAMKLDRLFRNAIDAMQTATTWDGAGVALVILDLGGTAVDSRSAVGRFLFNTMAAVAEMERGQIRERVQGAMDFRKDRGQRTGKIPLGFRFVAPGAPLAPVPAELDVVRLILARRDAGVSLGKIARELNQRETPTKEGGTWRANTVSRICARPRASGAILGVVLQNRPARPTMQPEGRDDGVQLVPNRGHRQVQRAPDLSIRPAGHHRRVHEREAFRQLRGAGYQGRRRGAFPRF